MVAAFALDEDETEEEEEDGEEEVITFKYCEEEREVEVRSVVTSIILAIDATEESVEICNGEFDASPFFHSFSPLASGADFFLPLYYIPKVSLSPQLLPHNLFDPLPSVKLPSPPLTLSSVLPPPLTSIDRSLPSPPPTIGSLQPLLPSPPRRPTPPSNRPWLLRLRETVRPGGASKSPEFDSPSTSLFK